MPLITLSSDIGQQDYFVGAIKGQLHSSIPNISIADITHYLTKDNFFQAAYVLKNAFHFFPEKTIHLVLLNVFENKESNFVATEINNQIIVCPDNGLITMLSPQATAFYTIPILNANTLVEITQQIINAIALLVKGNSLSNIGTKGLSIVHKDMMKPMVSRDWIEGQVLFIDNFENVIINITKQEFNEIRANRKFKIIFGRNEVVDTISDNYGILSNSENLAWFNSAGYLELSNKNGNLAGLFGIEEYKKDLNKDGRVQQNKWFYQTVRIFFE